MSFEGYRRVGRERGNTEDGQPGEYRGEPYGTDKGESGAEISSKKGDADRVACVTASTPRGYDVVASSCTLGSFKSTTPRKSLINAHDPVTLIGYGNYERGNGGGSEELVVYR